VLDNLNDDQLAVMTELAIHRGMLRFEKSDFRYGIYYRIAGELMEELEARDYRPEWVRKLMCEFVHGQLYIDPLDGGD
jgi:hypothetical protein